MKRNKITIQSTRNQYVVFQVCRAGKHAECPKVGAISGANCICPCHSEETNG